MVSFTHSSDGQSFRAEDRIIHLLERDRAEALLLIKQSVESRRRTIRQLFTYRNKLRPPESLSMLQRAILYWRHQNDGKSIIEDGLKEINERVKEISIAFTRVNTWVVTRTFPQRSRMSLWRLVADRM